MVMPIEPSKPLSGPQAPQPIAEQAATLAQSHRLAEALVAAILIRDVLTAWAHLDIYSVRETWPMVKQMITGPVLAGMARSIESAVAFYTTSRALAGIPASSMPTAPSSIASLVESGGLSGATTLRDVSEMVSKTLDSTGPGTLLHDIKKGQQYPAALQHAGVNLAGAAGRLVLQAGRSTVVNMVSEDQQALAWMRVTSGNPCAFCAMLASRGAVYKSEASASFEAHNHCMCVAAPAFTEADIRNLTSQRLLGAWRKATQGKSGADAFRAWRKYWDSLESKAGILALGA